MLIGCQDDKLAFGRVCCRVPKVCAALNIVMFGVKREYGFTMNTKTFHQMLHGSVSTGVSYIFVLETKQTYYFNPQDGEGFADFVKRNSKYTLFYGVQPLIYVPV